MIDIDCHKIIDESIGTLLKVGLNKMAQWRKVGNRDALPTVHKFVYRNKSIALFKVGELMYATDNICSHEYSELSQGMVLDGNVYCPKHGSRFDIKTGAVIDPPAIRGIKIYQVKIEDGDVYVKC